MHAGLSNGLGEISVGEEFGLVAFKTSRNKIQPFYIYSYGNDFYLCFLLWFAFLGAQKSRTPWGECHIADNPLAGSRRIKIFSR